MNKKHAAALVIVSGVLFALLALVVVRMPSLVLGIDTWAAHLVVPLQSQAGTQVFYTISFFGSVVGVCLVAFALLLFSKRLSLGLPIALGLVGSSLTATYIKYLLARPRPTPLAWLTPIHSYSFPSGHATSIMVLYGSLGLYALLHTRVKWLRMYGPAAAFTLVFLVGLSRIVLDYHYLSDVLGGYLLGLFWIGLIAYLPHPTLPVIHTKRHRQ